MPRATNNNITHLAPLRARKLRQARTAIRRAYLAQRHAIPSPEPRHWFCAAERLEQRLGDDIFRRTGMPCNGVGIARGKDRYLELRNPEEAIRRIAEESDVIEVSGKTWLLIECPAPLFEYLATFEAGIEDLEDGYDAEAEFEEEPDQRITFNTMEV